MSATIGTLDGLHNGRQGGGRGLVGAGNPHDVDNPPLRPAESERWSLSASAVSVLVIVCTVIGESPPTGTEANHDPPRFCGA